jgi:hypothetical protein
MPKERLGGLSIDYTFINTARIHDCRGLFSPALRRRLYRGDSRADGDCRRGARCRAFSAARFRYRELRYGDSLTVLHKAPPRLLYQSGLDIRVGGCPRIHLASSFARAVIMYDAAAIHFPAKYSPDDIRRATAAISPAHTALLRRALERLRIQ